MGFLSKHCQLSWQIAVHNCKLIFDGLTDLEQRKQFVSSFQNAVEICLKQYLIDKNDISVLHSAKMSSGTKLAIYNNCQSSSDYNVFFDGLTSTQLDEVYSNDFGRILNSIFDASNPLTTKVAAGFSRLKELRNKETHFYISENDYLSIDDFKKLCNLMRLLQDFFIKNNIIESVNKETLENNAKYLGYFDESFTRASSYANLIKTSKTNILLLKQFLEFESKNCAEEIPRGWMFYVDDVNDLYTISHEIYEHHGIGDGDTICFDFLMNFNEFYRRFRLWVANRLVLIDSAKFESNGKKINAVFVSQSKRTTAFIKNKRRNERI